VKTFKINFCKSGTGTVRIIRVIFCQIRSRYFGCRLCRDLLLQGPDCLELLDDRGEGVGYDGDHDEEGEEQDEDSRHDELDVSAGDPPLLLEGVLADAGEDGVLVLLGLQVSRFVFTVGHLG